MSRRTCTQASANLPTGYQELIWISTNGAAAFKVSYNPKGTPLPGFKLRVFNVKNEHTSTQRLFGVWGSSGYTDWGLHIYPHNHASYPDVLRYKYISSSNANINIDLDFEFSGAFIQEAYLINGSGKNFIGTSISVANNSSRYDYAGYLGIGSCWSATSNAFSTYTDGSTSYINYLALYKGTTMSYEFIPCRRLSDGKIGMYDKVNSVFHASETSTEFGAGNPA